ncbi:glutamate racemase [Candidatus Pseudomonas adelgestsugas]|nr:glutamate racemase [Candidatus Pseudomonas adelgestsugas]
MFKNLPIGVFDSGIGGLSVLYEIQQLLPHESLLYLADCRYIPYGEKSSAFILKRSRLAAEFFRKQNAKVFVIACNTATIAAVSDLRQDYPKWPLVGMEPAIKPAAAATRSCVVGILATTSTLQSAKFTTLLNRFATDMRVITQPCPGLVELIETGDLNSATLLQMLHGYLRPLLSEGCDTIILGCTHYFFLKPLLAQILPRDIIIIDTGPAVALQLKHLLNEHDLLLASGNPKSVQFWTSGNVDHLRNILPILWKSPGVLNSFNL